MYARSVELIGCLGLSNFAAKSGQRYSTTSFNTSKDIVLRLSQTDPGS
jgi:hypothetical protein